MSAIYRELLCPLRVLPITVPCLLHDIRERYLSFIAHTSSCARPKPSFRLGVNLERKVFAGCCESPLGDGLSRRYLRIPCIGAWTPTPPRPSGASTCFFPESIGLTSRFTSSARETIPAMQLSAGERFRSCSHSVMFRLPCLLGPPVAPTAVGFAHRAAGPFTPRNGRVVTLHELWHRYIPEPGNWYGGTFTHWNAALSAATESLRSVICPLSSDFCLLPSVF